MGLENPMIITHLERATQLYQALQDYQQSTHAFSQPSLNGAPSPNDLP